MVDDYQIREEIDTLQGEHQNLDKMIDEITDPSGVNQLQVRRLKKRKLWLKDRISQLMCEIEPDIIA
jgi:hypothetical protein